MSKQTETDSELKEFFKKWPRLYYFVYVVFGPLYFGGLSPKGFLRKYCPKGKRANLGSGPRTVDEDVLNVDLTEYPSVDVVADLTKLPFADGELDGALSTEVLEHIEDTDAVIEEMRRVVKADGYVYVSLPFLYPFHASPSDFHRWTHKGLEGLFEGFRIVELGVRSGPFSTLTVLLMYIIASLVSFSNERVYWFAIYASMFLLFPIKFLDVIGNRLPFAKHTAALLYCVVQKK
jgi:SAM-dependent methyltransferase